MYFEYHHTNYLREDQILVLERFFKRFFKRNQKSLVGCEHQRFEKVFNQFFQDNFGFVPSSANITEICQRLNIPIYCRELYLKEVSPGRLQAKTLSDKDIANGKFAATDMFILYIGISAAVVETLRKSTTGSSDKKVLEFNMAISGFKRDTLMEMYLNRRSNNFFLNNYN